MSDSDDTDDLLLIPPTSLQPHIEDFSPYFNVVDSLITQVTNLEDRINLIETSSDLSELSEMQSPTRLSRPGFSSLQSTPQKPRSKFTISSLPNSPNGEIPPKKTGMKCRSSEFQPMVGEIDNFLSNVKYLKRLNTYRNLETDFSLANVPTGKVWNGHIGDNFDEKSLSSGSSLTTVYDMGKQACGESKKNNEGFDKGKEETCNLGLMSLAKLWAADEGSTDLPKRLKLKLQEEKLRREHCERTILDLQNRILELQERVAVAIQVDDAKDKAISRFHENWEKSASKLCEIERQKERLEEEVNQVRQQMSQRSEETNEKLSHYEKEASLAMNLAHSSRDKATELERKCQNLELELKTAEINSTEFQKKYLEEADKNKQFVEILAQKELELNETRGVLNEVKIEISESRRAVDSCQSELESVKTENNLLQIQINAELENKKMLSEQNNKLLEEASYHKNKTKSVQEELTRNRQQLEKNKVDLRLFYQGQVESVVQSKLKEFQKQLDETEKALKTELSKKELAIAKTAAAHIQQISEKHILEIKLLEERHQEEDRLRGLHISQLQSEVDDSKLKLKRQAEKNSNFEKQLHKFVETLRQDETSTLDEIKSFNNLEEILSLTGEGDENLQLDETPLKSGSGGGKKKDGGLQETVNMLLNRRDCGKAGKPSWK